MIPEKLNHESIAKECKLFPDRNSMIEYLAETKKFRRVGEVGVALGEFSEFVIRTLVPEEFVAYDMYELHKFEKLWGTPTSEIFLGKTHKQYYNDRINTAFDNTNIRICVGISWENLEKEENNSFDLIYIDADHNYQSVLRDAKQAEKKICDEGVIIFNDYIMWDPHGQYQYGVVHVVNDMVVNGEWEIFCFAFHNEMFCDIALMKKSVEQL